MRNVRSLVIKVTDLTRMEIKIPQPLSLETVFHSLNDQDKRILFAALYAARDIHAPLDTLPIEDHDRIAALSEAINDLIQPDWLGDPPTSSP